MWTAGGAARERCQRSSLLMLQEDGVCKVGRGGSKSGTPGQVTQAGVSLSLTGIVVQMRDQANPQRVCAIQALNDAKIAGCFSQALPETQTTIVHRQGMGVKVTWGDEERKLLKFYIVK